MTTTFSKAARSERHFSALLLPHLLMSNNFAGCRALFGKLKLCEGEALKSEDVEIVAELNPARDVADDEDLPNVVPDLFLRVGDRALVIEAKFFTYPPAAKIINQLKEQRKAIEGVLHRTEYKDCTFHYLALTVDELGNQSQWDDVLHMTWCEMISVLEDVGREDRNEDTEYALYRIKDAVERSKEKRKSPIEKGRYRSIEELLHHVPMLLKDGNLYIGFQGGRQALKEATAEDLDKRMVYKYSDKEGPNWIPLDKVISHYLEKKVAEYRNAIKGPVSGTESRTADHE